MIYCHYTKRDPRTEAGLPPEALWVDVSASDLAYFEALSDEWDSRGELILCEHDVVFRPDVFEAFASCPEPWCTFQYDDICHPECREAFQNQLGCTRFRAELVRTVPNAFREMPDPERLWPRVNEGLGAALRAANFSHHWHLPPVVHHHNG